MMKEKKEKLQNKIIEKNENIEKLLELKSAYKKHKINIKKRLDDFSQVPKKDYFYELCFCICTPQSNAQRCWNAIENLKKDDFQNQAKKINPKKYLIKKVRFHNHKSKYLLEWKQKNEILINELLKFKDSKLAREHLVKNVLGLGYKEAGHFLRNIGHTNLAILDRHILKNMIYYGAIKKLPKTLNKKNYFFLEEQFQKFAKKMDITMDELDLLFWSKENGEIFK